MTIQRQYSLPNCKLILDGWSSDAAGSGREKMSILTHAELRFSDPQRSLGGGQEFLASVVSSASAYAQEFLSQVRHPEARPETPGSLRIDKGEQPDVHRLTWQPKAEGENGAVPTPEVAIELTTVQLFDLVEAIDQFLSDPDTLPELTAELAPKSRRDRAPDEPLARRAIPATIGMASLALASVAFVTIPAPEVRPPDPDPDPDPTETLDEGSAQTGAIATTIPPDIEMLVASIPPVADAEERDRLAGELRSRLEAGASTEDWERELTYRVWTDSEGTVLGYREISQSARSLAEAPALPQLIDLETETPPERVAQFRVTFTPEEEIDVQPWE